MALIFETIVQEDLNVGVGTVNVSAPGGGVLASTQVGLHSLAVGQLAVDATWDPASLANLAAATTTVTVAGAATTDFAYATHTSIGTNAVVLSAVVSSANTVNVTLLNCSGAVLDIATGTLRVVVFKVKS